MFSNALPGVALRGAARTLGADLREARSHAIARNREIALTLDLSSRRYAIDGDAKTRELPQDLDIALRTATSELDGNTRGSIRFFPDGSSTGGRIKLSRGESTYYVTVDWLTGRISVVD